MRTPRTRLAIHGLVVLGLVATPLPARAVDFAELIAIEHAVQAAVDRHEAAPLLQVRARIDTLAAAEPSLAALSYWEAVADWRLAELALPGDRAAAARYASAGESLCGRAFKLEPANAEALALRGALRGQLAQAAPGTPAGSALEAAARADLDRALSLAPRNPRAWLFQGLAVLRRPVGEGGGPATALGVFARAQEVFAVTPATAGTAPDWGWDDVFLWSGRCAMSLGSFGQAHLLFTKALEMNPRNQWVRRILLPAAADSVREHPGL